MRKGAFVAAGLLALLTFAPPVGLADEGKSTRPPSSERRAVSATGEVFCGGAVTRSIKLQQDLGPCPNTALSLEGVVGITLDLNGHTISGQGAGMGIDVFRSKGVTVKGGTIQGFSDNIRVENSSDVTIRGITALNAGDEGIQFIDTKGSIARNNAVVGAADFGMSIYSDYGETARGNAFVGNEVRGASNGLIEVGLGVGPDDAGGRVLRNRILNNRLPDAPKDGILLRHTFGNLVRGNEVSGAGRYGINAIGESRSNRIVENEVTGSATVDLREEGGSCANTWRDNVFGSKQPDCID